MRITGTGFYVPERTVLNAALTDNPGWVSDVIGINERHWVRKETASDLAFEAAIKAIRDRTEIGAIIVATATPDMVAPSTACILAGKLGIGVPAFDINAVCSGFLYGMKIADSLPYDNILLVGVDVFSTITDYSDRNCVFFGDGAGAVVISKDDRPFDCYVNAWPYDNGFTCEKNDTFEMDGRKVYDMALDLVPSAIEHLNTDPGDITWMVPHQPSKKVLHAIADRVGFPRERVLMNMDRYANTSAATIPILLAENWNRFNKGDKLLFAAIGSGWTYGAAIYEV
jgi:3-oxoacyl-[acyl-carrier-protein] synthase-3